MADPLSIIASAIAVGQAGESLTRILSKAKRVWEAPEEVNLLANEVAESKTIISSLQNVLDLPGGPDPARVEILAVNICRYGQVLEKLEKLVENTFIKSSEVNKLGQRKVHRHMWAMKKSKVEGLRQRLKDIRLAILGELATISTYVYNYISPSHITGSAASPWQPRMLCCCIAAEVELC
jgi:hypothetical protein